jgi:cytochrome c nitrite reductase small subunit
MPVAILLGIFAGLAILLVYISKAPSYLSDDPKSCVNCHVMNPQYSDWMHASHRRAATCNDCHIPHDNIFNKYFTKAEEGLKHATYFTMRWEPQVIYKDEDDIDGLLENCRRCHENTIGMEYLRKVQPGYHNWLAERSCMECHRESPHRTVNGLSSAPNALISQRTKSRIPAWLDEIMKK